MYIYAPELCVCVRARVRRVRVRVRACMDVRVRGGRCVGFGEIHVDGGENRAVKFRFANIRIHTFTRCHQRVPPCALLYYRGARTAIGRPLPYAKTESSPPPSPPSTGID